MEQPKVELSGLKLLCERNEVFKKKLENKVTCEGHLVNN